MKPNRNDFKVQNLQVPKLRQPVLKVHGTGTQSQSI